MKNLIENIKGVLIKGILITGFYIGIKYYVLSDNSISHFICIVISGVCFVLLIDIQTGQI